MDDERLEALARRLGGGGERRVDPDRVVEGVLERLRSEPPERPQLGPGTTSRWRGLAVAAVLLVATGIGILVRLGGRPVNRVDALAESVGLAELGSAELAEVMDSLEGEAPVAELVVGLDDLSEEQLEKLLRLMEG